MRKFLQIVPILIAFLLLSACASSYHAKAQGAYTAYHLGDSARALELIKDVVPSPRDKLLHLLDLGMILHAAEEYEESNLVLTEAEKLSDQLSPKSLSREAAAALWSEEAAEYSGEKHERVLVAVIRILNYLALDDWPGALVEVRRVGLLVEKIYGKSDSYTNAFALYLSAIVWEAMGQINDAMIDYRRLARSGLELPYYAYDLKFTGKKLGMFQKLPKKGSLAWTKSPNYRKRDGELIVIVETGVSPKFISEPMTTGYFHIEMPTLVGYPNTVNYTEIKVDGEALGRTYPFYDVAPDLGRALNRRRSLSIKRKIAKVSTQTALYATGAHLLSDKKDSGGKKTSRSTEEQVAGLVLMLIGASMSVAESTETRSWRTFPASLQIGRFYLKEGEHDVEILPQGHSEPIIKKVEISGGHPSVIIARAVIGGQRGKLDRIKYVGADQRRTREELDALAIKIKKNPDKGGLRIERARMRVENGDYNIESEVVEGMLNGGNKSKAVEILVIAGMVKGAYQNAERWSEIAVEKKLGNKARYTYYEKSAAYLRGNAKASPGGAPSLTKSKSIGNAFNYFVVGLILEKKSKFKEAVRMYAAAVKYGLKGKPVADRFLATLKKTPDDFKKSTEGKTMISTVADTMESDIK